MTTDPSALPAPRKCPHGRPDYPFGHTSKCHECVADEDRRDWQAAVGSHKPSVDRVGSRYLARCTCGWEGYLTGAAELSNALAFDHFGAQANAEALRQAKARLLPGSEPS